MISNKEYSESVGIAHRKKYAQFFTPEIISDFMAQWILASPYKCSEVLDPAFGLGVFCNSLLKINTDEELRDKILEEVIQKLFIYKWEWLYFEYMLILPSIVTFPYIYAQ